MSKKTDSNSYTIIFAIIMVFIVSIMLSGAFILTKNRITFNKQIEKKQNILFAIGINKSTVSGDKEDVASFVPSTEANALFKEYIKGQFVLENNQFVKDDEAYLIDLKKELDKIKKGETGKRPILIAEKEGEKVYVIPVRGNGLWDAIWGYIAINDKWVVQGVYFDHKGETPGLGAEIKAKYFQERFLGEKLTKANGDFSGVEVAKGNNDPKSEDKDDNQVDAISGATITGDGVTKMIQKGLKPYFGKLEELNKNILAKNG